MAEENEASDGERGQRLDVWLWHARMTKSRTLASKLIDEGKIRVNRVKIAKSSHNIKPGDVITAVFHGKPRVLRVRLLSKRRGPPAEARVLYDDIAPTGEDNGPAATSLLKTE